MINLRKPAALLAAVASFAGLLGPIVAKAETLKAVMNSDLKILDPIWTTAYVQRGFGYMVWDRAGSGWSGTLFDVNVVPTGMSPARLQQGLVDLSRRLYDREFIQARRERFFRELKRSRAGARAAVREGMADES